MGGRSRGERSSTPSRGIPLRERRKVEMTYYRLRGVATLRVDSVVVWGSAFMYSN